MSDEAKVLHEFSDGEHGFRVDEAGRATWFPLKRPEDELDLSDDYDANFAYAAGKEIARLVSSRRWIPVSDATTKDDSWWLGLRHGVGLPESIHYLGGQWLTPNGIPVFNITHVMPLPEAPKP